MNERHVVPRSEQSRPSLFESVATFAIIAALLYLGAGIFVPLVLAVLLAFALTPLVNWLNRRLHLPDAAAVILAVVLALATVAIFVIAAGSQIVRLAEAIPGYQETISTKIAGLQKQFSGLTFLDQIDATLSSLSSQLSGPDSTESSRPGAPVPVVISNDLGSLGILTSIMGSILSPVATVAIVTVILIFLLMSRGDLQDRFIRLVSAGRYSLTNLAISDASQRVGRYLFLQLIVNVCYGTIFGIGLWLIGVPSAVLWGLLIMLFRYIPFVGALIIATVPFLLAFAVDPGWNMLLMSVVLFLVLDQTTANVIEPRLYGSSTGVSALAILLSALFWATLWGPVGLILSTPMTVCLVVIGRHLPQLQFFETLLGSDPVLAPAERLYQRMLKGNTEDAIELSDSYVEENGRDRYVAEVMMPALTLAQSELSDGPEALSQRRLVIQAFEGIIEEIGPKTWPESAEALIIGGRTEIDESTATLIAMALLEQGDTARVLPPVAVRQEAIGRLDLEGVDVVTLIFMGPDIRAQSRYVSRRIRRMAPEVSIIVGALHELTADETPETLHVDGVYHTLDAVIDGVAAHLRRQEKDEREAAVARQPFFGSGRGDDALGRALVTIAESFGVPVAAINLLADERHIEDEESFRLTRMVTEKMQPLVITSDAPNPLVGENLYLQSNGIDLYAGVPLVMPDKSVVGTLVLLDYEPHKLSDEDVKRLQAEAHSLAKRFAPKPAPRRRPTPRSKARTV